MWDSDTLRQEAEGLPGVVEIIVGMQPRHPDVYYERRIEIQRARLADDPNLLNAYDDLAVALDRLGRSGDAIGVMGEKAIALERVRADGDFGDHRYRSHANLGTFHAHRWLQTRDDDLGDLDASIAELAKALDLNPDAHFGREQVQVAAIEWVRRAARDTDVPEEDVIRSFANDLPQGDHQKNIEGLVGLIALGNAWESVDVLIALWDQLISRRDTSIATIAEYRIAELARNGATSLDPHSATALRKWSSKERDVWTRLRVERKSGSPFELAPDEEGIAEFYGHARRLADRYRADHAAWVTEQVAAGRHPDTHADFWTAAPEPPRLSLPNGFFGLTRSDLERRGLVVALVVVPVGGYVGLRLGIPALRRRLARRYTTP